MIEKTVGGELEVRDVSKRYGTDRSPKTVVENCSFTVERGKLTVMIGPSGSGKSTIVRLLASFEQPSTGSILLNGKKVTKPDRDRLVVFQESALYPWMTTYENVVFGPKAQGRHGKSVAVAARNVINRVGLNQFQQSYPNQLSGGMQRRAELARALINNPAVMILDEPFRRLDDGGRSDAANQLKMTALSILHEEAIKSFAAGNQAADHFMITYGRRYSSPLSPK